MEQLKKLVKLKDVETMFDELYHYEGSEISVETFYLRVEAICSKRYK